MYCWLVNTRGISKALSSKIITGSAFALALAVFLSMGLASSCAAGSVLSSLSLGILALSRGGWSTNHVEIAAPEHAAMLYSVANCISAATSVVGISVTGKLLDAFGGSASSMAWTVAMGTIGAGCGACGLFYVFFAKGNEVLFPADMEAEKGGQEEVAETGRAFSSCWPRPSGWGDLHSARGPRPSSV